VTHAPGEVVRRPAALAVAIWLTLALRAAEIPPAAADPLRSLAAGQAADQPPTAEAAEEKLPPLPPVPFVNLTRPGQFEVVTLDLEASRAGPPMAAEVWQTLAGPLLLPAAGFSSPVSVRLVLPAQWSGAPVFRSALEPGGRVTLAVRWTPELAGSETLRRALVQALLMQRAVSILGAVRGLKVPPWLEDACVSWSLTHTRPALLDAWQQESARVPPPPLAALLSLSRGTPPDRPQQLALLWLMGHLQAESDSDTRRWPQLLRAVLGGEDSAAAVQRLYGNFFNDDAARELWWQVGYHTQRRQAAQAIDSAAETRAWLAECARWIARRGEDEFAPSLEEIFAARSERWVAIELDQRIAQLKAGLAAGRLHPFYRNATVSLGRVYDAVQAGDPKAFASAQSDLLRDVADASELEQAANTALDKLDNRR
jgi:hypothetical protein